MVIFPLAPDQTIAQMWSNGVLLWGSNGAYYEGEYRVRDLCREYLRRLYILWFMFTVGYCELVKPSHWAPATHAVSFVFSPGPGTYLD